MHIRKFITWLHVLLGGAVSAYFYSPLRETPEALALFQYMLLPGAALSGLYLWQGHKVKKVSEEKVSDSNHSNHKERAIDTVLGTLIVHQYGSGEQPPSPLLSRVRFLTGDVRNEAITV